MEDAVVTSLPALSAEAERLLTITDGLPIRMRERDRLIAALGLHSHGEWSRVELALEAAQLESLRWSEQFTSPHDLAHVIDLSRLIASAYDSPATTPGHLAVALAVSARLRSDEETAVVDVVSTAFHLGHLEESSRLLDHYLQWMESVEDPDDGSVEFGYGEPWFTVQRILPWLDPLARVAFCIALVTLAARSGTFWAWPIAFAVLVPFRDRSLVDTPGITRLPVGIVSRWPVLLLLAGTAGALRLWGIAGLLVIAHVALEGLAVLGEHIQARSVRAHGPGVDVLGDRAPAVVSAFRVLYRYPVHDRQVRFLGPLLIGFLPVATVAEWLPHWPLCAVVFLLAATGRPITALLAGGALLLTLGWYPQLPAFFLVIGALTALLVRWDRRIPTTPPPVGFAIPRVRPLSGTIAVLRARRLLGLGKADSAVRVLERWCARLPADRTGRADTVLMLLAWALLDAGQPGRAWDLRDAFPRDEDLFRVLVIARSMAQLRRRDAAEWGAQKLVAHLGSPHAPVSTALRTQISLFVAEVLAVHGDVAAIAAFVPPRPRKRAQYATVRLLRLAGESAIAEHPALAERFLAAAAVLGMLSRHSIADGTIVERGGMPRALELEGLRAVGASYRLNIARSTTAKPEDFTQWRYGCEASFRLGNVMDTAFELIAMADAIGDRPEYRAAALDCRIDALAVLNTTRHDLTHREDRLGWWNVYAHALHPAMADAVRGKDWAALAELIESARLQSDPRELALSSLRVAPFVRVQGRSRLEEAFWQRADADAPVYDLEAVAASVLGPGTWWWSTWRTGDQMQWALVRPGAAPLGGTQPYDEVAGALARLRDAIPLPREGESREQFELRIWESPLVTGPRDQERDLARALSALLPARLLTLLREQEGEVSLAIAPAAEYAHVPWASIVVDDGDTRLVERARIAIAPPVALLADVGSRTEDAPAATADDEIMPVSGAVVDPGGDRPEATGVLGILPDDVRVLTSVDEPDTASVGELVRTLPRSSTFLFVGHTLTPDGPDGRAAIYLGSLEAGAPPADMITSDMLSRGDSPLRLPRSVILLACGSGDLQNATSGEWSTLAPALLWSGASRAVVTSFPIVDAAQAHRELAGRLDELPLHEALWAAQRAQLDRWRATFGGDGAPVHWGGHVAIGAFAPGHALRPRTAGTSRRWIDTSLIELIDRAAADAHRRGRADVAIGDLWTAALTYGWDDLPFWRRIAMETFGGIRAGRRSLPSPPAIPSVAAGAEIEEVLVDAARIARMLHHRVIRVEHLLAALMRLDGALPTFVRLLSGRDPRRNEELGFFLEKEQQGWEKTGVERTRYVDADSVHRLAQTAGVETTLQLERWFFTDR